MTEQSLRAQHNNNQLLSVLNASTELLGLARFLASETPETWLAAGCVVQTVWNALTDRPAAHGILDYDLVYFDPDENLQQQEIRQRDLSSLILDKKLDIKNQALVHQWYPQKFALNIPPFGSLEAALCTWPSTATATAVRYHDGQWQIMAPFGLDDLLALCVRPNATLVSEAIYLKKSGRWKALWPEINLLPFKEAIGPFDLSVLPVLKNQKIT